MKIAYVSREFGVITGGGIGTYIANVTQEMVKRGHDIYLITDCFTTDNVHYLPQGVKLIPVQAIQPNIYHHSSCLQYSDRVYNTLKLLDSLDVIEFSEYGAEGFTTIRAKKTLNEFANTKLIVKLHTPSSLLVDIDETNHRDVQNLITIYAEDYCVKNADIVTSPSNSLADYFQKRLGIQEVPRSPYPLSINKVAHREFDESQVYKVIFVGSIQVRKGIDIFIEAAKIILEQEQNFIFELWGRDTVTAPFQQSYKDYLEKRIPDNFKQKILFKGAAPYEQIANIFSTSCFAVFPSRWENWPNVCLEAMSLGCVVIGSKNGGMSEMIEHGISGYLVDPYKPDEIANIILSNFQDLDKLQKISEIAQGSIQLWCNPKNAIEKIESVYQRDYRKTIWDISKIPKVSVVIPLYNQGKYIQEAINSIQESTYKNVDIVVVNDGSTEQETNDIFDQLEGVVKIYQKNGGLSSARNTGIQVATGEYILLLDADDKVHPLYIEKAAQALVNNQDISYIACYTRYFEAWNFSQAVFCFVPELMLFMNTDSINSSSLYRKEAIVSVGGFDEEMISYEDWSFYISMNEAGLKGDVIPLPLFYYRRRYDSMVFKTALPRRMSRHKHCGRLQLLPLEDEGPMGYLCPSRCRDRSDNSCLQV
jgi:glycosyltransferase involved in cell wall biosynthesis